MTATHTLKDKGAAFTPFGERVQDSGTGGEGHALCSCGWLSEALTSGKQRVAAHKRHKEAPEEMPAGDLPVPEPTSVASPSPVTKASEIAPKDAEPTGHYDFPGNYSIVMIPFAIELAKAYGGVEVVEEKFKGSLVRRANLYGTKKAVAEFVNVLDDAVAEAHDSLHAWQKKTVEERRSQTDMQRFIGNRDHLTAAGKKIARRIKKERG